MTFNKREQRAIMLETQRPAYARSSEARRRYRQYLQESQKPPEVLPKGIRVSVRAIVPHQNQFVSGLNVPSNFATLVGQIDPARFERSSQRQRRHWRHVMASRNVRHVSTLSSPTQRPRLPY